MKGKLLFIIVALFGVAFAQRNYQTNQYPSTQGNQYPGTQGNQYPGSQGNQYDPNYQSGGGRNQYDPNNQYGGSGDQRCTASPGWPIKDSYIQTFNNFIERKSNETRNINFVRMEDSQEEIFTAILRHMTGPLRLSESAAQQLLCEFYQMLELLVRGNEINRQKMMELIDSKNIEEYQKQQFKNNIPICESELSRQQQSRCDLSILYLCLRRKCEEQPPGVQGSYDPRYPNSNTNYNNNNNNNNNNQGGQGYNDPNNPYGTNTNTNQRFK